MTQNPLPLVNGAWAGSIFPPNGHTLAGAINSFFDKDIELEIKGCFFCFEETLYFPTPLGFADSIPLVPIDWDGNNHLKNMLSNPKQPQPLGKLSSLDKEKNQKIDSHSTCEKSDQDFKYRKYFPTEVLVEYLQTGEI